MLTVDDAADLTVKTRVERKQPRLERLTLPCLLLRPLCVSGSTPGNC